ncbi:MAG: hypothetical protein H6713_11585 [Myxococcales bacterium]|nr:hypothetical protein [Myxococcales bacterium]MCB9750616.1 hypothetical protein [Myxococcales bacterium]
MTILHSLIASLLLAAPISPKLNTGVVVKYAPDLTCSVRVSHDAAGTKLVTSGGSYATASGSGSLYVHVMITNKGPVDAALAKHRVSVQRSGSSIASTDQEIAIPAGLSKVYDPIQVPMTSLSNHLAVAVSTDANNQVSERSEQNNACSFSFDYSTAH